MTAAVDLRGLFFDFDGTIAETERLGHRVAYNRAFADHDLDWTWDDEVYGELLAVAGGRERLRRYIVEYRREPGTTPTVERLIEDLYRAKSEHFRAMAPSIPFRPGIPRLIREAHAAGIRVAICTTGAEPGVHALLAQDPAVAASIDLVVGNQAVANKKPAPDVYLWALARLELAPNTCVAIEDSAIGLRAALAAKLATIVTVSDYTRMEDFTGAAAVLSTLGDAAHPARCISGTSPHGDVVTLDDVRTICLSTGTT